MFKKRTLSLILSTSILSFFILLTSTVLTGAIMISLIKLDIIKLNERSPFMGVYILLALSMVIGTISSIFAAKFLLKPLLSLSRATKEVAKGNFNFELQNEGRNELGELTRNFNMMAKELNKKEMLSNSFINDFSHEIKTPLAAIEGCALMLENDLLSDSDRKEYTEMISHNVRRLSVLSGSILRLSKLENQEIVTEKKLFPLDEQIREALLILEKKWTEKGMDLDLDLDSVNIFSNEEMLMQVWINLIDNAIKFSNKKGTLSISCKQSSGKILVIITDYGVGMREETCLHIFDKFYQGDHSHSSLGNGLGLSIVNRIVNLLNGEVQVSSDIGLGSCFTITLPNI